MEGGEGGARGGGGAVGAKSPVIAGSSMRSQQCTVVEAENSLPSQPANPLLVAVQEVGPGRKCLAISTWNMISNSIHD